MTRGTALRRTATGLAIGVIAIAVVSAVIAAFDKLVVPHSLASLYLFAILPVAIVAGFWTAGIVAVASFVTFDFFFAQPVHSFAFDRSDIATALATSIVVAYVVSALARRMQLRAGEARSRAREAEEARDEVRRIAEEQAALRRVATLVAEGISPTEIFETVAREVGLLFGADFARLERYEQDGTVTGIAGWSRTEESRLAVGTRIVLEGISIAALVKESGRPMRIDDFAEAAGPIAQEARSVGIRSSVGCPIVVAGATWGVVAASSSREAAFPPSTEVQLGEFTELVATAIANAEAREELRRVADEQAALRRVATLVASGAQTGDVFTAVAAEVGGLLTADVSMIGRYDGRDTVDGVGGWNRNGEPFEIGATFTVSGRNVTTFVVETGRPSRLDSYEDASGGAADQARTLGLRSSLGAPVSVEGRLWGVVVVASTREGAFPPGTEERLAGFAELVATAIANAEARAALSASRARIVATADETRRKIERDLHDGAQQRLVSLALQLRAAQAGLPSDLGELTAEIDDVAGGLADALDELREFARGIHPAILAEGGLAPALETLALRSAVPVELAVGANGRLAEAVEVAAYYVVSEALANATKHARASRVLVEVETEGDVLRVRVSDDGVGGADLAGGSGLVGLKDRVEALGGRIMLQSSPGVGTTLSVDLPLEV